MSDDNPVYVSTSTSSVSSRLDDIELSVTPAGLARKVLRAEIVENPNEASNTVKIALVHQKRASTADSWSDDSAAGLNATTVRSPSKFPLDTSETNALAQHLAALYQIGEGGVRRGQVVLQIADEEEIIRTDGSRAALIRRIIDADHGEEMLTALAELVPGIVTTIAAAQLHHRRQVAIDEFAQSLEEDHDENYWNDLLTRNRWMFGGSNVAVIRERRVDTRHTTDIPFEVDGGYMDVVELKRPNMPFWAVDRRGELVLYRDKFLVPHYELRAAISQTEHYILQAEKRITDSDFHVQMGITPLKPRGLVVHGRSHTWAELEWQAFRLLNDGLHGVQVMTFDHLLVQAKRMVELPAATVQ